MRKVSVETMNKEFNRDTQFLILKNENQLLEAKLKMCENFIRENDQTVVNLLLRLEESKEQERKLKAVEGLLLQYEMAGMSYVYLRSLFTILHGKERE